MNTETMKHYIDFSAENGIEYMMLDEGWSADVGGRSRDLTKTNPKIDLPAIMAYAKQKNVGIWLWCHWTFVDTQMDEAFPLFEKWGVKGVKIDFMDRDDQDMVNFYHRVMKKSAEHRLMVDFHGAYKPCGLRRYYPNLLTREGGMSLEYAKWSNRVTADHNVHLAFTRMLAGPLDYTPGGFFNVAPSKFVPRFVNPTVPTTRAHQVALYVVIESGFTMLADYPGAYKGQPEAPFIMEVPVAWDETRVVSGHPDHHIVTARRKGLDWYVGGITNGDARELKVPLSFLPAGRYMAEVIADAPDADVEATKTVITKSPASAATVFTVKLAPAGGFAMMIKPVE
jgi:alpha-glucosidase